MPRNRNDGWLVRPGTARGRRAVWQRDGYQLEYRVRSPGDTPDTGWYLFGPNGFPFGEYMGRTIATAFSEANSYLKARGRYYLKG